MNMTITEKNGRMTLLLAVMIPALLLGAAGVNNDPQPEPKEKRGWLRKLRFTLPSPREFYSSVKNGDNRLFEALFRPLEFREPVLTIPAEGRYGLGFYGWKGLNPININPRMFTYESDTVDAIPNIAMTGRMGSFLEFEAVQTNLTYAIFKKSYVDFLTGFGLRYSSVIPFPKIEISKRAVITGPPTVPSSWGVDKKFAPSVLEANIVSSFIMQWDPRWFLHFKYSYGFNHVRFYRDDVVRSTPYGRGRSSTYSVGMKIIRETEKEVRYAWGVELRHVYHNVTKIIDPDNETPISGFRLPNLGIYFTFSAFYGGRSTVGDEGKKLFLRGDYVAAKPKLVQFIKTYPEHARIRRARRLLSLTNERIPQQLYSEGLTLEKRTKIDRAVSKFLEASKTADESLKKTLTRKLDQMAEYYMGVADSLFKQRKDDDALRAARKAAAISEWGKRAEERFEGRLYLEQGKDLAFRGLYHMALRKYAEASRLAPSLKDDVRKSELEAVVGMVEDVNRSSDVASLRIALKSLYSVRDVLAEPDFRFADVVAQLEKQLATLDHLRLKELMDASMNQAREEIARRHMPRVELGMLVSEVQDILGDPDEVVETTGGRDQNYQMWIYRLSKSRKKLLYFEDYVLFKME